MGCCQSSTAVSPEEQLDQSGTQLATGLGHANNSNATAGATGARASGPGLNITSFQDTSQTPNLLRVLALPPFDLDGTALRASAAGRKSGLLNVKPPAVDGGVNETLGDTCVKVAVLVRPLLEFETAKGNEDILQLPEPGLVKLPNKAGGEPHSFEYDACFRMQSDAALKSMLRLSLRLLERFACGYNASVLAYGQTGSGKTYTMGTAQPLGRALQKGQIPRGVIPVMLQGLFDYLEAVNDQYNIVLKVSFMEIYEERLQDLLLGFTVAAGGPGCVVDRGGGKLDVREAGSEVVVDGAVTVTCKTLQHVAALMDHGSAQRATAAHKMNEASSRSHAILTLCMEQRVLPTAAATLPHQLHFLRSRLNLVDLAGSERQKDTGAEGARFSEGVAINKGLLVLGNVINALADSKGGKHVPYRESKLTRVLQDSLGGTAETLLLACVSPATCNSEQTLNTLRYAQRARSIKNRLRLRNQQSPEEELVYLRDLVLKLQAENAELQKANQQLVSQQAAAPGTGRVAMKAAVR